MYGTSYEMGVAYGALLKDEKTDLYTHFYQLGDEQRGPWGLFPYPLPPPPPRSSPHVLLA